MVNLEIPALENEKINFCRLESDLGRFLCNDPKNTSVNLIAKDKYVLEELRDHLQSSFDYKLLGVKKTSDNYLIKVGASDFAREACFINNERGREQSI